MLKFTPIFHFDRGNNGRICHILCVKVIMPKLAPLNCNSQNRAFCPFLKTSLPENTLLPRKMPLLQSSCFEEECEDRTIFRVSSTDSLSSILFISFDQVISFSAQWGKTLLLPAKVNRHFLHLYSVCREGNPGIESFF